VRNKAFKCLPLPLQHRAALVAKSFAHIANTLATSPTSASSRVAKWKARVWMMHELLNVPPHPEPLIAVAYSKAPTQLLLHPLPISPRPLPLPRLMPLSPSKSMGKRITLPPLPQLHCSLLVTLPGLLSLVPYLLIQAPPSHITPGKPLLRSMAPPRYLLTGHHTLARSAIWTLPLSLWPTPLLALPPKR
jgi:hypothetical protein